MNNNKKSAYISLIGKPNVGKSTLLNCLIGEKIAIVTPKVQTTRTAIKGIRNYKEAQLIFIDTPGIFTPHKKLEKLIVKNAEEGLYDADMICILFDASKQNILEGIEVILEKIEHIKKPIIAVLNKIDLLLNIELLFDKASQLQSLQIFQKIFMISALKSSGINDIVQYFSDNAPHKHWFFDKETITDENEKEIAEEITREQIYLHLNKELPYSLKVETDKWEEDDNQLRLHQSITTTKPSHKAIIIGKNGRKLKSIGIAARLNIQRFLNKKVHLSLFVKVREDWIEKTLRIL